MELSFANNKIEELRQERNLSQRQLAKLIGISQASLSRWEQAIVVPGVLECWKIADFFGVTIDYLCGRTEY